MSSDRRPVPTGRGPSVAGITAAGTEVAFSPGMGRIDAHQHFWRYTPEEFDWLEGDLAALRRDFVPADLLSAQAGAGIAGTVAVEARQSTEETLWLLELARGNPSILAVVGWLPITAPDFPRLLDRFADEALPPGGGPGLKPPLAGLRHVLQGEEDSFMLSAEFTRGLRALTERGLVYDILVRERQLPAVTALVDAHPRQVFVLDHIAKPGIREGILEPWASGMRKLSKRPNVWVKVSGLVTEADAARWTIADLCPYWDAVLESFGPGRLLFGSDWPVCEAAGGYGSWVRALEELSSALSPAEKGALWGSNARKAYLEKEMPL